MCYDYHGKWDKKTGHNAPLGPRPDEAGADLTLNLEYTVQYLLQVGVTCPCHVSRGSPAGCGGWRGRDTRRPRSCAPR